MVYPKDLELAIFFVDFFRKVDMAKVLVGVPDTLLELTDNLVNRINEETGIKHTRSGLIQLLLGLLVKNADGLVLNKVYDEETLKDAIVSAICKPPQQN